MSKSVPIFRMCSLSHQGANTHRFLRRAPGEPVAPLQTSMQSSLVRFSWGAAFLCSFLAAGCKKEREIPADADAIVAEAREQLDRFKKLPGKMPSSIEQKPGPECGAPKKTLVLSRSDLERAFIERNERSGYNGLKDGRMYEAESPETPAGWVFPASFTPSLVAEVLRLWEIQRHPGNIENLREALDSVRPFEHIAVYMAAEDSDGGCMTCGPAGTFRPATLKALAVVFDRKTIDVVCHASLQVESSKELTVGVRPGERDSEAGTRALWRDLGKHLRDAVNKRFGASE